MASPFPGLGLSGLQVTSLSVPQLPPDTLFVVVVWALKNVKFFFISKGFPSHQSKLPAFTSTNEQNHFLCELVHLKGFILNDKVYDMHALLTPWFPRVPFPRKISVQNEQVTSKGWCQQKERFKIGFSPTSFRRINDCPVPPSLKTLAFLVLLSNIT